jgi:hypothetical protein
MQEACLAMQRNLTSSEIHNTEGVNKRESHHSHDTYARSLATIINYAK